MHLSELFKNELAAYRKKTGKTALSILETGTIRNEGEQYQMNDGWSTVTFAEDVRDNGGSFRSIDLHIGASENVLSSLGLREYVQLYKGYSVDVLAGMLELADTVRPAFDVVLLDSDNDGVLILDEFFAVRRMMNPGALLLVDDVDLQSTGVVKGHMIAPWLDSVGATYRIETRTGRGYQTGVLIAEL